MKKLTICLLAAFAVAGTSFAGTAVVSSKEYKQPVLGACFQDQELQLDVFYSYNDALHQGSKTTVKEESRTVDGFDYSKTTTTSTPQYFRDGSGGGVGINYFFARYFGVGLEGNWWVGVNDGSNVKTTQSVTQSRRLYLMRASKETTTVGQVDRSAAQQLTGNLILRYPFEGSFCWAPYVFGGGGGIWDGKTTGFADVGLGAEFRITPHVGIFADWRWEFTGEEQNRNDINLTRTGVRFIF